jgi:hypothetical protein
MMVSVPHLRGLQVQHCTVSLPRIDALLDDPDTRYFVPVKHRAARSVLLRGGARHRGPRRATIERMQARVPARRTFGTLSFVV